MASTVCNGFKWSGIAAGIKQNGKKDLGLVFSTVPAAVAAVFTRNRVKAAPVLLDAERVKAGVGQAILVNSGNANCCNGEQGLADARTTSRYAAEALGLKETQVLVASTGVIGVPLPVQTITRAIPAAVKALSPGGLDDFADCIMTTDKYPKIVTVFRNTPAGRSFAITAIAKGAGMIRPDMATMLCFVCTDVQASPTLLSEILAQATDRSFNRITVDGDTSTNDTVILMANGLGPVSLESGRQKEQFQEALDQTLRKLAKMMVADGEGATKVVEIEVRGALSSDEARLAAETVATSPLVKTAFFGEDANWGRIAAAVGRSGADFDPERLDIFFGPVWLVAGGRVAGGEAETAAAAELKKKEITVRIDLNTGGQGRASMLTCDLSLEYVKINADYRS